MVAFIAGNLLAGCSKSDVKMAPQELTFRAVTATAEPGELTDRSGIATKADPKLTGTTLGTDNTYVIYASASLESNPTFMTGQLYSYVTDKWRASSAPGTASPVYWPLGGVPTDFLACACKPAAYTALSPAWNATASANGFTITGWDTAADQYDVMYAYANGQTAATDAGKVNLTFRHTMAALRFKVSSTMADIYTVQGVQVNGLEYEGTLTVDNSRTEFATAWTSTASGDKLAYKLTDPASHELDFAVTTTAAQCAADFMVMPQVSKSLTVLYKIDGCDVVFESNVSIPRVNWKPGYIYTYSMGFVPDQMTMDLSFDISTWDDATPDITVVEP